MHVQNVNSWDSYEVVQKSTKLVVLRNAFSFKPAHINILMINMMMMIKMQLPAGVKVAYQKPPWTDGLLN